MCVCVSSYPLAVTQALITWDIDLFTDKAPNTMRGC